MSRLIKTLEKQRISERPVNISEKKSKDEIIYPESDGKPMADNTRQFEWIVKIKEGLESLFSDNPDVFIAGDFFWYPVEGNNKIRVAPDAMVVFGRPKGHRGSYLQWKEGNITPQVVFEILSPCNTPGEMKKKLLFYEKYGVEEYYIYDPDNIKLNGYIRSENKLIPVNMQGWISPRLKIRFEPAENDLNIFRPDGEKFLTPLEIHKKAEKEKLRAEKAQKKARQAESRAKQEKLRAEMLEARVKELEQLIALRQK